MRAEGSTCHLPNSAQHRHRCGRAGLTLLALYPSARALDFGYLTQDMIDDYEPALMFTIPRLAIVW